jgi:hypothetical protein
VVQTILTTKDGAHEVTISPDESTLLFAILIKQTLNSTLQPNKKDAILTPITHSTTKEFEGILEVLILSL